MIALFVILAFAVVLLGSTLFDKFRYRVGRYAASPRARVLTAES